MIIRSSARLPLSFALLIAALLTASLARAGDSLVWISKSNGALVTLAYGPVDPTKAPLFLLSCFNGMDIAVLDVHQEIAGGKPGEKLAIELSAGTMTAPLSGETAHDEASDVYLRRGERHQGQAGARRAAREGPGHRHDGRDERHARRAGPRRGGRDLRSRLQAGIDRADLPLRRAEQLRRHRRPCRALRTLRRRCRRHRGRLAHTSPEACSAR